MLFRSVVSPLRVFNRGDEKGKISASITAVLSTAVLGSVITPIVYYYSNRDRYALNLDIGSMLTVLCVSILTWLAVCLLFWVLSKAFHNGLSFRQTVSSWGFSYIPNFLCVLLYGLLQVLPDLRIESGFLAFVVGALFILFLVWKTICYFMFLRFTMNVSLGEFVIAIGASAIVFAALLYAGSRVGIQVPML